MKHALTLLSILTITAPAVASANQDIHIDGEHRSHCSIELNHSTRVGADFFEITHDNQQNSLRYQLQQPKKVQINGQPVALGAAQQRQMEVYHTGLYQSGKDVTEITIDAVDIAMEGVGIALTTLAGRDHPDYLEFQEAAAALKASTRARLRTDDDIYVLGGNWDDEIETTVEEAIERELEPRIEKIAMESAGTIAWHALKAVFTGGRSIEKDAEAAAEAAEDIVEARALQLESRAENLCHNLTVMDTIEVDLQSALPELQEFDVISLKQGANADSD